LKKGVEEKLNKIDEISENASKEFSLENALLKMEKEWELLSLVVVNYKNRGVLVL
jgi:dynein heavy chain